MSVIREHGDLLDLTRLDCNDVHAVGIALCWHARDVVCTCEKDMH